MYDITQKYINNNLSVVISKQTTLPVILENQPGGTNCFKCTIFICDYIIYY